MSLAAASATLLAVLLLMAALLVRHAGEARILNGIDYGRVTEARALNRWAGGRLAIAAMGATVLAGIAWRHPHLGLPLLLGQGLVVIAGAASVASGAGRFQRPAARRAA